MSFDRRLLPDPTTYFESEGLKLKRGGKWRTTECRFHGGSDSMRVNSETGAFCCMAGCGARGGDILAYQMAMHGIDFVAAAKALGAWVEDKDARTPRRRPLPFPARDALEILAEEANIVALAGANLARGVPITEDDKSRILTASRRITSISEAVL